MIPQRLLPDAPLPAAPHCQPALPVMACRMGDVVEGLKDAAAAVSAQAAAQGAGGATPGHHRGLSDGRAAAQAEAEAAWRAGGDGAKWLECLDDTDVAGKRCWPAALTSFWLLRGAQLCVQAGWLMLM